MADKVSPSELTLSDLIAPRDDSMGRGYAEVSHVRDEASSPTAQLIAARKLALTKTFKKEEKPAAVLPTAGIVAPGAEPDARGVPAAPGDASKGGLGHVESQSTSREPLVQEGTIARRPPGPDILPSAGEALKMVPGGLLLAAKRFGETLRDLAASAHAAGVEESAQEIADAEGISLEEAKKQAADSDPLGRVFIKALTRASEAVPQTGEPPSILGGFFKEAVAFLAPFMAIARSLRAAPAIKAMLEGGAVSKSVGLMIEGAVAGLPAGVISLDSANPTNLVNALPDGMRPAALEFLAAPVLQAGEEIALEQRFKERLKAGAVGTVVGAPLDMVAGAVIAARQAMRLKAATRKFDRSVEEGLGVQRKGERGAEGAAGPAGPSAPAPAPADVTIPTSLRIPGDPSRVDPGLGKVVLSWLRDETGSVTFGRSTKPQQKGWIGPDGQRHAVSPADAHESVPGASADKGWVRFTTSADELSVEVNAQGRERALDLIAREGKDKTIVIDFVSGVQGKGRKVMAGQFATRGEAARWLRNPTSAGGGYADSLVRQAADAANVTPAEMGAAAEVAIKMADELGNDAAEIAPVLARHAKQMFDDGVIDLPENLRDDAGFSRVGLLWFLSRTAVGALFGASGEQTTEDRIAGAIVGGGIGAGLSPALAARLVKKLTKVADREKARLTNAAQAPGAPIRPESDTFSSVADEFASRVKEATRGEVLDPETGFVKVRPREVQAAEAEVVRQQMTPEAVQQLMPTIRMNDAESIAMAQVMTEVGLKVRSLAISAKQGGFRPDDINELLKELYVLGRMDPKRLGALAEAGRTLGALNDPVSGQNQFLNQFTEIFKNANSTVTPQRVADAIASLKTPEELAVFARQLTKPGFSDYFYEVWINGLLSGPKTLLVNGLGNTSFLLYNIGERSLAAGIRSEGGVAPGEATAMLHGIIEAHSDALRAFWALTRDAAEIPTASKLEAPNKAITAEHLNLTGAPGRAVDFLGSVIRTPGRVLAGTDEYFKGIATRAQVRSLAKREAFNEVERLGLRGTDAVQKMNEIEQAFLTDPPIRAMQQARSFAEYVTFTQELGETGQAIQALQRTAFGRIVVPFVRTPINLAKSGLERSGPLGLASRQLRTELNSSDPAIRDIARAKIALSSMTLSMIGVMAANGYVTGGGPQDPVLRKQWLAAGYIPYAFDVGAMLGRVGPPKAGDLVSFGRVDPISMPWGMMADVVTIMGHLPPDEQEDLASALVIAFSKNFTSKTFVQGVARTTAVMADPERMGGTYLKNFLTSTLPFSSLLRQAATALDPELKDAQDVIEEFQRRIPGAGGDVPNDLDLFGNPRFLGGGLGRDLVPSTFVPAVDFVMPIYVNTASKEHQALFVILNENAIRAAEAPKSIDGVILSNVERAHLRVIAGREITPEGMTMPQALKKLFASPAFKAAAPGRGEGREALVNIVIRGYYQGALEVLMDRFKDLKRDVRNARVKRLRSMGVDPRRIDQIRTQIGVD